MNLSRRALYSYLLKGVGLVTALLFIFYLEPRWASCLSTLSGTVLFCAGVRSGTFAVRMSGLLLQCIGFYLFLDAVWYPFRASILLNSYFLGSCFIVLSAFFSAYYLESKLPAHSKRDRWTDVLLLFLGTLMWYAGGFREVYSHIVIQEQFNGVLLFMAATSIIAGIIAEKSHWQKPLYLLLLQLPMTLCILIIELLSGPVDYPLLIGWGTTVWPVTFFVQYRILAVFDGLEWSKLRGPYHLISLWMIIFVSSREFTLKVLQSHSVGSLSVLATIVSLILIWLYAVQFMAQKRYWPVAQFHRLYLWGGGAALVLFIPGWFIKLSVS